jgi:hypothetical protein
MISIISMIISVILFLVICFVGIGSTYFMFKDKQHKGEGDERNTR